MLFKRKQNRIKLQDSFSLEYSGFNNLQQVEIGLVNYNNHLVSIFVEEIKVANAKVLDFGAGTGALAENFRKNFVFV